MHLDFLGCHFYKLINTTQHVHGEHAYFYSSPFHKHIFSRPSKHLPLSFTCKQVHTKGLSPPPRWPPPLLVTQLGTCFLSHWIPIVFSSIHKAQLRQWVHSVFGPRLKLLAAGYCRVRGERVWKVNSSAPPDTAQTQVWCANCDLRKLPKKENN